MKKLPTWTKLPTGWIEAGGLQEFRWLRGQGADNAAALMALAILCHHADSESGVAHITYDELSAKSSLSRAKLSRGLTVLSDRNIIDRKLNGRSSYHLANYSPQDGWAKFPANGLYRNGIVTAFSDFRLRLRTELDALKLYFLFASRRNRQTNTARISYEKIEEYSGVTHDYIRRALSVLAANGLVHIHQAPSSLHEDGVANSYRLAHLDSYHHMGTVGRAADEL